MNVRGPLTDSRCGTTKHEESASFRGCRDAAVALRHFAPTALRVVLPTVHMQLVTANLVDTVRTTLMRNHRLALHMLAPRLSAADRASMAPRAGNGGFLRRN